MTSGWCVKPRTTDIKLEFIEGKEMSQKQFDNLMRLLASWLQRDLESSTDSNNREQSENENKSDLKSSDQL